MHQRDDLDVACGALGAADEHAVRRQEQVDEVSCVCQECRWQVTRLHHDYGGQIPKMIHEAQERLAHPDRPYIGTSYDEASRQIPGQG